MVEWTRVKWTEAGQITRVLGWDDEPVETLTMPPCTFFAKLKSDGRLGHAVAFLAQALPRFDAVSWAVRFVHDSEPVAKPESPEANALKSALLWLQDPSEERRRTAFVAARKCKGAESMAAMAVFFSGGSIAPLKCDPQPAPPDAAGRFAAVAVRIACARSADRERAFRTALETGERLACKTDAVAA